MSQSTATRKRTETILALLASGLTQAQVAQQVGCSTKTVQRHADKVKPAIQAVNDLNARAKSYVEKVFPIEKRIDRMVELAKDADNDSVSLAAVGRLDDYDGFLSEKERIRAKQTGDQQLTPMFVFNPGVQIDFGGVTINQQSKDYGNERIIEVKPVDTKE